MQGRNYNAAVGYRYGFNGKENDNEVKGEGNSLDFGDRIYDSRIGRWLSIDPLQSKYPMLSPYNYVNNSPTTLIDIDGRDFVVYVDEKNKTITIKASYYTDNNKATLEKVQAALDHINSQSGKYEFSTKNGDKYDIQFDFTMKPYKNQDDAKKDSWDPTTVANQNMQSALKDDEANYIREFDGYFPLDVVGNAGETLYGGDQITYATSSKASDEVKKALNIVNTDEFDIHVITHEILHSLGISHDLMGQQGSEINENVIATILQYASKMDGKNKIDVKGVQKKWFLDLKRFEKWFGQNANTELKGEKPHTPRGKIKSDQKVNLNGTVNKKEESKNN